MPKASPELCTAHGRQGQHLGEDELPRQDLKRRVALSYATYRGPHAPAGNHLTLRMTSFKAVLDRI